LVGWNVAIVTRVSNVVIAQTVKVHGHCVPTFARYARYLSTVEVRLKVGAIADVNNFVSDIECDLAREEGSGLDTDADCPKILKSK
jgi:hypothetical protein